VRRAVIGIVLAVTTVGCTWRGDATTLMPVSEVVVQPTPTEYARVSAGPVEALVPPEWRAIPAPVAGASREGFVASPRPRAWRSVDGATAGLSATWVDSTRVGVPSDYYYLAATGPLLSRLRASDSCRSLDQRIYADNAPAFATGSVGSTGDYVASGEGVCDGARRHSMRYAYFVAAPGMGPTRAVGIPSSGLYVVVAVTPDLPEAEGLLEHLLAHTRFGDAAIGDFVRAIRRNVAA
jgi:hypothetical protein